MEKALPEQAVSVMKMITFGVRSDPELARPTHRLGLCVSGSVINQISRCQLIDSGFQFLAGPGPRGDGSQSDASIVFRE